jgi:hypothetical protein
MPPIVFVTATGATGGGGVVQYATPASVKPGDVLIAILACGDRLVDNPLSPGLPDAVFSPGWDLMGSTDSTNGQIYIARRVVQEGEPLTHEPLDLANVLVLPAASAMLVYRGIDPAKAIVGLTTSDMTAQVNHVCPSRALATYSDLYLGIVMVRANVTITAPAGTVERYQAAGAIGGTCKLQIFELLAEATGATGTKTATTAANQTGLASSAAIAANPTYQPRTIDGSIPGSIGIWGEIRARP